MYCQNILQISTVSIYFMISAVYCNTNVQSSGSDSHESQCALPSGTHLPFLLSAQPSVQAKHTALLQVAHPTGHLRHSRRFLSAKYPSGQTLEHVPDRAYRPGRHVMHCVSLEPLQVSHDEWQDEHLQAFCFHKWVSYKICGWWETLQHLSRSNETKPFDVKRHNLSDICLLLIVHIICHYKNLYPCDIECM